MIELSGIELLVPTIVSVLVVAVRNISDKLDGTKAYWWCLVFNVIGQVAVQFASSADGVTAAAIGQAAMLGIATGATVSVGVATAGKRIGLSTLIKPKS